MQECCMNWDREQTGIDGATRVCYRVSREVSLPNYSHSYLNPSVR